MTAPAMRTERWVPRDGHLCELPKLVCPRCGKRVDQSHVHFFPFGGLLRCTRRAGTNPTRSSGGECGVMLYVLPWPEHRAAYVHVATMAQITSFDRWPTEGGRPLAPRDILVGLGAFATPHQEGEQ